MSSGAYHYLVVAAGTLRYLPLTPRQSSVAYRKDDCCESRTGHSFQYKVVYVDRGQDIHSRPLVPHKFHKMCMVWSELISI